MFLHISFSDGSNPTLYSNIDQHEMNMKIKLWRKNYTMKRQKTTKAGDRFYIATEKTARPKELFCTF